MAEDTKRVRDRETGLEWTLQTQDADALLQQKGRDGKQRYETVKAPKGTSVKD